MRKVLQNALAKLRRDVDGGQPVGQLAAKSARYALSLATSRLYLAGLDEVGEGVRTEGRPRIDNQGFLRIGHHTLLRSVNVPVELATAPGARLEIGAECSLNYGVSIGCMQQITLGDRCRLGPYVMIVDNGFHELYDRSQRPPSQPVRIEDDVWIGAKASIMPGVTLGRGSVVGTGSVVTRDVPPFTVVAGLPAKVIQQLDPEKFVVRRAPDFD